MSQDKNPASHEEHDSAKRTSTVTNLSTLGLQSQPLPSYISPYSGTMAAAQVESSQSGAYPASLSQKTSLQDSHKSSISRKNKGNGDDTDYQYPHADSAAERRVSLGPSKPFNKKRSITEISEVNVDNNTRESTPQGAPVSKKATETLSAPSAKVESPLATQAEP